MFELDKLIRPNIKKLKPYSSARDEFSGEARVYLDANENSFGSATDRGHNRYPDPLQNELKARISEIKKIPRPNIFIGNGSDEAIDLLIRAFCDPKKDKILTVQPSYGLYEVSAGINDVEVSTVTLKGDYSLDAQKLLAAADSAVKILFLCSPNNPTGNIYERPDVLKIIQECNGKGILVVLDEAYVDFCPQESFLSELTASPNLVVLQTLSKAWGLAEIRVGMAFASAEIVTILNKIKAPYNVSGVSQKIALAALSRAEKKDQMVKALVKERDRLTAELEKLPAVEKIYPSKTNYLFVKVKDAQGVFKRLLDSGVVVRDRSKVALCEGCFRITLGTFEENEALCQVLAAEEPQKILALSNKNSDVKGEVTGSPRMADINRKTNETAIEISLNLDGAGDADISSGIGFFDHMLLQIVRHAGVDLFLRCKGDLHVDEHHSIEDTGLALGEAFSKALGSKRGIERYGFVLPMDESLAQVALDFSGRSRLVWNAEFKREKIGDMPCEMFQHFFKSFCDAAKCNLNVKVEGENEHHKIESIFKAFAKAIKQAVKRDPEANSIPSTKGSL